MLYQSITIGNEEYKCRLNSRNAVALQQKLGKNPLLVFTTLRENQLPDLAELLTIWHYSMIEFNHNIKSDDVYDLYDRFCDDGGDITTFINFLIEVFIVSGLIPKGDEEEKN